MNAVTFAHVSDLHLPFEPVLSLAQKFSKRQLSAWSWQRRRALHSAAILDALAADLRAYAPDHIAVTGDITNFSLPAEFEQARAWLAALTLHGQLSVVPGNHDALVPLAAGEGLERWSAWTRSDAGWPFVHYRDRVALIGLNSALPTAPLLARGRLGAAQLARLEQVLQDERDAGRVRVVLIHHPVAAGAVRWRKALADAPELREVLRRAGAELVLHGHAREARLDALAGAAGQRGRIPCLCVPSSSAVPNPRDAAARWHLLRVHTDANAAHADVRVRQWSVPAQAFVDAAQYTLQLPRTVPPPSAAGNRP